MQYCVLLWAHLELPMAPLDIFAFSDQYKYFFLKKDYLIKEYCNILHTVWKLIGGFNLCHLNGTNPQLP